MDRLRQIGAALINGWLVNEIDSNRRCFVKESDRPSPGGGNGHLSQIKRARLAHAGNFMSSYPIMEDSE